MKQTHDSCLHLRTAITHDQHHMIRNCLDCGNQTSTLPRTELQVRVGEWLRNTNGNSVKHDILKA